MILACAVTVQVNDKQPLTPMVDDVRANLGDLPARVVAVAGYGNEERIAGQPDRRDTESVPEPDGHCRAGDRLDQTTSTLPTISTPRSLKSAGGVELHLGNRLPDKDSSEIAGSRNQPGDALDAPGKAVGLDQSVHGARQPIASLI
jgi:hypothetical protein